MPIKPIPGLMFQKAGDLISEDDCAENVVVPLLNELGHRPYPARLQYPFHQVRINFTAKATYRARKQRSPYGYRNQTP
jgi:hypothetical protein